MLIIFQCNVRFIEIYLAPKIKSWFTSIMQMTNSTLGGDRTQIINRLQSLIGQDVSLYHRADHDMQENCLAFNFNGVIEKVEDSEAFYIRVKECYQGTSGMQFMQRHVAEIIDMPSGRVHVMLK